MCKRCYRHLGCFFACWENWGSVVRFGFLDVVRKIVGKEWEGGVACEAEMGEFMKTSTDEGGNQLMFSVIIQRQIWVVGQHVMRPWIGRRSLMAFFVSIKDVLMEVTRAPSSVPTHQDLPDHPLTRYSNIHIQDGHEPTHWCIRYLNSIMTTYANHFLLKSGCKVVWLKAFEGSWFFSLNLDQRTPLPFRMYCGTDQEQSYNSGVHSDNRRSGKYVYWYLIL